MKQDKNIQSEGTGCAGGNCFQCNHCSQVNFEEIRDKRAEVKTASDLYAAEAQHYYFYFSSLNDRVLR